MKKIHFKNKIVVLGFGSISRAVIPLVSDHFNISRSQIKILAKDIKAPKLLDEMGVTYEAITLSKQNYQSILDKTTAEGDLLVNLTAEVSCFDLIRYCSENHVLYLDTCIELWPDEISPDSKTYDEREMLLDLQKELPQDSTTALCSIGANPGVVSLLAKRLLIQMCKELNIKTDEPETHEDWANMAKTLTVRAIHINERDTQYTNVKVGDDDFISTWSVEAMIVESIESAEMSIGSHEKELPDGSQYSGRKNKRDIFFDKPGKEVKISTWLPLAGEQRGMILNHNEPMSLAELFSTGEGQDEYSPTVCFVYHPCDQTMLSLQNLTIDNYLELNGKLSLHDIIDGHDELGVFIMTENYGSFWLGSRLSIHTARTINPESSATSLQVAGGVIAGMCWVASNRNHGVLEPEDIEDHDYLLDIADRYWGGYFFAKSNWLPGGDKPDQTLQFTSFLK